MVYVQGQIESTYTYMYLYTLWKSKVKYYIIFFESPCFYISYRYSTGAVHILDIYSQKTSQLLEILKRAGWPLAMTEAVLMKARGLSRVTKTCLTSLRAADCFRANSRMGTVANKYYLALRDKNYLVLLSIFNQRYWNKKVQKI